MKDFLKNAVNGLLHIVDSFYKFAQGSIVSIVVIAFIFFLLTKLEQAFIMVIALNEVPTFSFALSNLLIFALALSLSHYPIYTYYAGNVNGTRHRFFWKETRPLIFLRLIRVRYFETKPENQIPPEARNYSINVVANILRYSLGFIIFYVWFYVIWRSYAPNFNYQFEPGSTTPNWIFRGMTLLMALAFVLYMIYKNKLKDYMDADIDAKVERFFIIASSLFITFLGGIVVLVIAMSFTNTFSPIGLILNMALVLLMTCTYFLFRLLRSHFTSEDENGIFDRYKAMRRIRFFRIQYLQDSVNYLKLLTYFAVASFVIIVIANIQVFSGAAVMNGIPIVLAYLYFYSFLVLTIGKYFFVAKVDLQRDGEHTTVRLRDTPKYNIRIVAIIATVVIGIVPMFFTEQNTNTLCPVDRIEKNELTIAEFENDLRDKDTLFFIASHGGGLMANTWTLKVLNKLQRETDGKLLQNTIAVSGASGGSLGLSLYLSMYGQDGNEYDTIAKKIDRIVTDNYTSVDLTLLFGVDSYRGLWPFRLIQNHTRTFYKMQRYQRYVNRDFTCDDRTPFREYWRSIYTSDEHKKAYAPSLIMNTAGMDGRRGILWSVQPDKNTFDQIFQYAVDLAEMKDNKTLSYFDATSLTNRFPVFSPSAKIEQYGHFIDAGAIDNSGLLGCLDVLKYLAFSRKNSALYDKQIVFIEIYNSKSLYIEHLLKEFEEKHQQFGRIHWLGDEDENSSLSNNITAGTNLDKFPGYLEGLLDWMTDAFKQRVDYIPIPLPRKVTIEDIEGVIKGKLIEDEELRSALQSFLNERNKLIQDVTEGQVASTDQWEYYEPVLARYLSPSVIRYNDSILEHQLLQEQFDKIKAYTGK